MTTERERFEAKFPVPENMAYFDEPTNMYLISEHCHDAPFDEYNARWEAWQAAKSDQAEELAKVQARIAAALDQLKLDLMLENERMPSMTKLALDKFEQALAATDDSGKVLVPIEPTEAMLVVGNITSGELRRNNCESVYSIYKAMVAAAKESK